MTDKPKPFCKVDDCLNHSLESGYCGPHSPTPAPRKEGPAKVLYNGKTMDYDVVIGQQLIRPCTTRKNAEWHADILNKALAPLLARAECGKRLAEAVRDLLYHGVEASCYGDDGEPQTFKHEADPEKAKESLAAWDSIKKEVPHA